MVKTATNVSLFGPLRDIRLSDFKPYYEVHSADDLPPHQQDNGHGGAHPNGHAPDPNGPSGHDRHSAPPPSASSAPAILESQCELIDQKARELAEEFCQSREAAALERGRLEAEEQFAARLEQQRAHWAEGHRAEVIRSLERINGEIHEQIGQTCKLLKKHLVQLAAEAAMKLVAGLPISTDMVEASVHEAIHQVAQETEVTVILHPDDLALLEEHQSALLNRAGTFPLVRFRPDPKLSRGGCLVESKFGEIDARRETKLELLKKAVNE